MKYAFEYGHAFLIMKFWMLKDSINYKTLLLFKLNYSCMNQLNKLKYAT